MSRKAPTRRCSTAMGSRGLCMLLSLTMVMNIVGAISEFHVNTSSGRIVDRRGRERIFHGLNVVMKASPWHPRTDMFDAQLSFADADIANLREWGLNVVRLAVMWPGVEPERGTVNQTYIQIMQSIVEKLHAAGIATLLEFHQDLFSSRFCGEGVPSWVLDTANFADNDLGNDMSQNDGARTSGGADSAASSSGGREMEEALDLELSMASMSQSAANLWSGSGGGAATATARDLSSTQCQSRDFVESFPEPLSGRWPMEPDKPGDHTQQQPSEEQCNKHPWAWYYFSYAVSRAFQSLYDNKWGWADLFASYWTIVATAFRDQSGILGYELMNEPWAGDVFHNPLLLLPGVADRHNLAPFYEKLQSAVRVADPDRILFMESVTFEDVRCGFSAVPGGAQFRNRTVLSYHYYQPPNLVPRQVFRERLRESKKLGCGAMLTEFFVANPAASAQSRIDFNYPEPSSPWFNPRPPPLRAECVDAIQASAAQDHDILAAFAAADIITNPKRDDEFSSRRASPRSDAASGGDCDTMITLTANLATAMADHNLLTNDVLGIHSSNYDEFSSFSAIPNPRYDTEESCPATIAATADVDAVDAVLAEADAHLQSWIGWEYKAFQNKTGSVVGQSLFTVAGEVNLALAKQLARTYPQAVMGAIVSFSFDPTSSAFSLTYVAAPLQPETSPITAAGEEEQPPPPRSQVFVHRAFYYPAGLDISVNLDSCTKVQESESLIFVSHSQACVGLTIHLRISKRVPSRRSS